MKILLNKVYEIIYAYLVEMSSFYRVSMHSIQITLKRILDFTIALLLLVFLSPVLLACALAIYLSGKHSILFKQQRPGLKGKIFSIYKFQTMIPQFPGDEKLDHERITRLGSFMRKTSLDELPQLFNVLKGDLSLVGPRPLLIEYLPLYNEKQKKRHNVKPGITGWAQINGRNAISWEQKFDYDVWYVENWSLLLDLKILALTFAKVIKRSGVNAGEKITMEKFKGTH